MAVRLQIRNDTAANWTAANPVLATGELAIETDTRKFKIGNGSDTWKNLLYVTQGIAGDTWKPAVSATGDLTWTKDSGATEPTQRNIKGAKGDTGDAVTIVSSAKDANGNTVITFSDNSEVTVNKGDTGDVSLAQLSDLAGSGRTTETVKGNADNINLKLAKSGDTLDTYIEKLVTVSASGGAIDLSLGNTFVHTPSGDRTYAISNTKSGAHSFTLIINMSGTVRVLTFPVSVKWAGGDAPDMSTASKTYVLTFLTVDSGSNWLGMSGGEF